MIAAIMESPEAKLAASSAIVTAWRETWCTFGGASGDPRQFMDADEMLGFIDGDLVFGGMAFYGDEFRIGVVRAYRGRWWNLYPNIINHGLGRSARMTAKVPKINPFSMGLMERLGMKVEGEGDGIIDYVLTREEGKIYEQIRQRK